MQNTSEPTQYILELPQDHEFLSFAEFNSYWDIGFFHEHLRVECCVRFLFAVKHKDTVHLNLMLIDPFHPEKQFALFQSTNNAKWKRYNERDLV